MFQGVQCIGFIPQDAGKNFSDDWHDSSDCRSRPGCLIKAKFPAQMWWWFTSAVCLCGCATWPHHLPFFATHWRHLLLHCPVSPSPQNLCQRLQVVSFVSWWRSASSSCAGRHLTVIRDSLSYFSLDVRLYQYVILRGGIILGEPEREGERNKERRWERQDLSEVSAES